MNQNTVFQYKSASRFLIDRVTLLQKQDRRVSIRQIAKKMGISHTLLTFLLLEKRSISPKNIPAIAKGFGLNQKESDYLRGLVAFEIAQGEQKVLYRRLLSEMNPEMELKSKNLDKFEFVSNYSM